MAPITKACGTGVDFVCDSCGVICFGWDRGLETGWPAGSPQETNR